MITVNFLLSGTCVCALYDGVLDLCFLSGKLIFVHINYNICRVNMFFVCAVALVNILEHR